MARSPRIVIVGASLAGLRAAEAARAALPEARLTIVGEEARVPYNRPPLSKEVAEMLAGANAGQVQAAFDKVVLKSRLAEGTVTWRLGVRAERTEASARTVHLSDGTALEYDYLVAASGLRPRKLPLAGAETRRHTLRTFDDALRLSRALQAGAHAIIVGGGFIGCEIAATARKIGLSATVVEPMAAPMYVALGAAVAAAMARFHRLNGVTLMTGRMVERFHETARGVAVVLDNAETIEGDLLIEAVGSHPNTEWLADAGLDLSNGVLCDSSMFAVGAEQILAVGDVARFPNAHFDGAARRVEHWCVPGQTAKRAAQAIAARETRRMLDPGFAPLPSFWSDQHGLRLQSFGAPSLADACQVIEGDLSAVGEKPCIVEYRRCDQFIGLLGLGASPAMLASHRARLEQSMTGALAA